MVEVKLIHKSDVFFDVLKPMTFKAKNNVVVDGLNQMHQGEMYIYQKQIYLFNGSNWYKANIDDIKEIKSLARQKQILIHFLNYDLLLFCNEYSHLMALRDLINIFQKGTLMNDDIIINSSEGIGGFQ